MFGNLLKNITATLAESESSSSDDEIGDAIWGLATKAIKQIKTTSSTVLTTATKDITEFTSSLSSESQDMTREMIEERQRLLEERERSMQAEDDAVLNKFSTGIESIGDKMLGVLFPKSLALLALPGATPSLSSAPPANASQSVVLPTQSPLAALQSSRATYCADPKKVNSNYADFDKFKIEMESDPSWSFFVESKRDQYLANEHVCHMHSELVPGTVSEKDFWTRYVFRLQMLSKDEDRRKELVSRLEESSAQKSDDFEWDDDDDDKKAEVPEASAAVFASAIDTEPIPPLALLVEKSEEQNPAIPTAPIIPDSASRSLSLANALNELDVLLNSDNDEEFANPIGTRDPAPPPSQVSSQARDENLDEDWDSWE